MKKAGDYIASIKNNKLLFITAAAVILMTSAAVLFFLSGENSTITLAQAEEAAAESSDAAEEKDESTVYVDIGGCVRKPGVYEVPAGSRIFHVIEKAGGVTDDADTTAINQAEQVSDGLKIMIPDRKSGADATNQDQAANESSASQGTGKININTADLDTLQQIPGVGPVTAEKIISYREENGLFKSIEEITNVSGIGEKTYEKLRDQICI